MTTCTLSQANPDTRDVPSFYQENLTRIYQFVYFQVKNREVAEDLTSQVFLKAVRHLDEQRSPQSIRNWLLQVAHTTVMDYWRSLKRAPATASLDLLLEAGWEISDDHATSGMNENPVERVRRILQQLPARYREVLMYRFLLKRSVSEVALLMGITETNARVLQFRALKRAATLESAMTERD